ncbi:MAG: hypothetical protein COV52_09075 [Gammaproteobacteria bacterium CG11_big_fil_rev_8_21_14_0_20_46_22]|nr:MAG: hypothetical protein COW05_01690 [Gammaproteobacteria bacterium CG12_big_fil_rev_8_21_14_0_65_46_12]PIR10429.1 MAG: hypothetical protein COV52_09075 [Gammaproteobacteria bacterium CG11_big_fil_rev_8_21_14_0_20_46_22]
MGMTRYQQAKRITLWGIVINGLLSVIKLIVGFFGHSQALVADGVHSLSDLFTDAMVLLATRAANQAPDEAHPYGHGRFETVAAVGLAIVLLFVGVGIGVSAIKSMVTGHALPKPDMWVLIVALISVVANEFLFQITLRVAKRIRSELLNANAWHNRGDALSSLVVLIGALLSIVGFHWGDAIAAVIVAALIVKMALGMVWRSLRELVDTGIDDELREKIYQAVLKVSGVAAVHQLRSRLLAGEVYLDLHVQVAPLISVSEGHFISEEVMRMLRAKFDHVKDITVHIDPEDDNVALATNARMPDRKVVEAVLHQADSKAFAQVSYSVLHYWHGELFVVCILKPDAVVVNESRARFEAALAKCYTPVKVAFLSESRL